MQAEYSDREKLLRMPIVALALVESNNDSFEREIVPMSCDDRGNIDLCENDANFEGVTWEPNL